MEYEKINPGFWLMFIVVALATAGEAGNSLKIDRLIFSIYFNFYKMTSNRLIGLFLVTSLTGCSHMSSKNKNVDSITSNKEKPNVVYIYADDLGLGMLSCYGQKIVHTPNIDRLASQGMRFTNYYGSHYCAPARASMLTGYDDCRPDKWKIPGGGIYERISTGKVTLDEVQSVLDSIIGKEPAITYLPQIFKKAGYVTGEVGKLEWGFSTSFKQMKDHGWDYYFGYLDHIRCHGFYPPFLFENGKMINIPGNTDPRCGVNPEAETSADNKARWNRQGKEVYSEDLFMNRITAFIQKNKSHPFFLYFPTQLPHGPVSIPAIDPTLALNDSLSETEKEYGSMVTRLDADVGLIMSQLKRLGIAKNTIVIFSSDNGHELYYSMKGEKSKPYRNQITGKLFNNVTTKFYSNIGGDVFNGNDSLAGLKRSNWEGGTRDPLIIRWPGKIHPGSVNNNLIASYDLISTMADLLNVKMSDHKDGISYLSLLESAKLAKEHEFVVHASFMGPSLVTNEGWKLRYYAPDSIFQLYYLPNDYQERHNVISKYPQKAKALKKMLLEACSNNLNNGWYSINKQINWRKR